ncbi:MAG: ATPase [Oscillospiraceae bacterium]|nr:ATPase [Oscillospiraceae bacterium]
MNVEEILDQMDELVDKSTRMPLINKNLIEAEKIGNLLDALRLNIPVEVRQARAIVADRSEIIQTARREGETIIRAAEERARKMVAEEEIVKSAQLRATEMMSNAQQKSREMRRGAFDFSEDMLRKTEEALAARLGEVRSVRQSLRNPATIAQEKPE